jgi:hypothetical protein
VATSYFRFEIGRRIWKPLHFATYGLFVLYAVHGLLTDPNLKDAPLDPLDAEKVYVELCILLVLIGTALRVRWHLRQPPPRQHRARTAARRGGELTSESGTNDITSEESRRRHTPSSRP